MSFSSHNRERTDSPHHTVNGQGKLTDTAWWGEQKHAQLWASGANHPSHIVWADSAEDLVTESSKALALDICEFLSVKLSGTTDAVFLHTLRQLLVAGEITFSGFMIRLSNLYPDEMEMLEYPLQERIQRSLGTY